MRRSIGPAIRSHFWPISIATFIGNAPLPFGKKFVYLIYRILAPANRNERQSLRDLEYALKDSMMRILGAMQWPKRA